MVEGSEKEFDLYDKFIWLIVQIYVVIMFSKKLSRKKSYLAAENNCTIVKRVNSV